MTLGDTQQKVREKIFYKEFFYRLLWFDMYSYRKIIEQKFLFFVPHVNSPLKNHKKKSTCDAHTLNIMSIIKFNAKNDKA